MQKTTSVQSNSFSLCRQADLFFKKSNDMKKGMIPIPRLKQNFTELQQKQKPNVFNPLTFMKN
jgi:hypothetical protein